MDLGRHENNEAKYISDGPLEPLPLPQKWEDRVLLCARSTGWLLSDSQTQKAALLGSRLSGMGLN